MHGATLRRSAMVSPEAVLGTGISPTGTTRSGPVSRWMRAASRPKDVEQETRTPPVRLRGSVDAKDRLHLQG